MNSYRTSFVGECPVNGDTVEYELLIETSDVIPCEELDGAVSSIGAGLHESIADDLYQQFGGRQWLLAQHRAVEIETFRGAE